MKLFVCVLVFLKASWKHNYRGMSWIQLLWEGAMGSERWWLCKAL